jgi:hypothetical protein
MASGGGSSVNSNDPGEDLRAAAEWEDGVHAEWKDGVKTGQASRGSESDAAPPSVEQTQASSARVGDGGMLMQGEAEGWDGYGKGDAGGAGASEEANTKGKEVREMGGVGVATSGDASCVCRIA